MMPVKCSKEVQEIDLRTQQNKKEIEILKLDLENLIKRKNSQQYDLKNFFLTTSTRKVVPTVPSVTLQTTNVQISGQAKDVRSCAVLNLGNVTDKPPQKVRSYDVEETRAYISKQREKRLEQLKINRKESQTAVELRKEKLKELHQKSLNILQNNLKRKKNQSQDTKQSVQSNSVEIKPGKDIKIARKLPTQTLALNLISKTPKVSIDEVDAKIENSVPVQKLLSPTHENSCTYDSRCWKAAVKIQSYYRKYRLQKSKPNHNESAFKNAHLDCITERQKFGQSNIKSSLSLFEEQIEPYPLNFASTVKRKLDFAALGWLYEFPVEDIPVTRDNYSHVPRDDDDIVKSQNIQKDCQESNNVRSSVPTKTVPNLINRGSFLLTVPEINTISRLETINTHNKSESDLKTSSKSAKSAFSQNNLNLDLKKVDSLQLLSNNLYVCDNKTISDVRQKKLSKQVNSSHSNSHKPLKQPSESDSDTSKNIPDISSEEIHSDLNEAFIVSKEMLSRGIPESELGINVEKLKDLKLTSLNHLIQNDVDKKYMHVSSTKENIKKINNIYENSESKSSSCVPETETNIKSICLKNLAQDLTDRRDSIIAFNKCVDTKFILTDNMKIKLNSDENMYLKPPDVNLQSKSFIVEEILSGADVNESNINENKIEALLLDDNHKKMSTCNINYLSGSSVTVPKLLKEPKESQFSKKLFGTLDSSKSVKTNHEGNQSEQIYSSNFSSNVCSTASPLVRPTVSLPDIENMFSTKLCKQNVEEPVQDEMKSIENSHVDIMDKISHSKFEAELHLLKDFNESLQQFKEIEKSLLNLHVRNMDASKMFSDKNTQTSLKSQVGEKKEIKYVKMCPTENSPNSLKMLENMECFNENSSMYKSLLQLSQVNSTIINSTSSNTSHNSLLPMNRIIADEELSAFNLKMLDILIEDEKARLENLKSVLTIREKALLDKTKGELVWLEIQKKQLLETGHLHEASLLKKKQRGIILKLQHEKQEMQNVKQMQKATSKKRKTVLTKQRDMIKAQLSEKNDITKLKCTSSSKKRQCSPVKVYYLHKETLNTESSVSRKNSGTEEILVTSRTNSVVTRRSEDSARKLEAVESSMTIKATYNKRIDHAKRSLLMREAHLQSRRKATEELLQWHQRLLEEERKITELEMATNTLISQVPSIGIDSNNTLRDKFTFNGTQLNSLWFGMTGTSEKKFQDDETYVLSQVALEKFCKDAKKQARFSSLQRHSKQNVRDHRPMKTSPKLSDPNNYSSEFESEIEEIKERSNSIIEKTDILDNEIDKSKSSLHELIENINNISHEISAAYRQPSVVSSASSVESNSNSHSIRSVRTDIESSSGKRISTDRQSHSKSLNLQSQIVKSLSELIKTQSPCQDLSSLRESSLIETPGNHESINTLNDVQNMPESIDEYIITTENESIKLARESSNSSDSNKINTTKDQNDTSLNEEIEDESFISTSKKCEENYINDTHSENNLNEHGTQNISQPTATDKSNSSQINLLTEDEFTGSIKDVTDTSSRQSSVKSPTKEIDTFDLSKETNIADNVPEVSTVQDVEPTIDNRTETISGETHHISTAHVDDKSRTNSQNEVLGEINSHTSLALNDRITQIENDTNSKLIEDLAHSDDISNVKDYKLDEHERTGTDISSHSIQQDSAITNATSDENSQINFKVFSNEIDQRSQLVIDIEDKELETSRNSTKAVSSRELSPYSNEKGNECKTKGSVENDTVAVPHEIAQSSVLLDVDNVEVDNSQRTSKTLSEEIVQNLDEKLSVSSQDEQKTSLHDSSIVEDDSNWVTEDIQEYSSTVPSKVPSEVSKSISNELEMYLNEVRIPQNLDEKLTTNSQDELKIFLEAEENLECSSSSPSDISKDSSRYAPNELETCSDAAQIASNYVQSLGEKLIKNSQIELGPSSKQSSGEDDDDWITEDIQEQSSKLTSETSKNTSNELNTYPHETQQNFTILSKDEDEIDTRSQFSKVSGDDLKRELNKVEQEVILNTCHDPLRIKNDINQENKNNETESITSCDQQISHGDLTSFVNTVSKTSVNNEVHYVNLLEDNTSEMFHIKDDTSAAETTHKTSDKIHSSDERSSSSISDHDVDSEIINIEISVDVSGGVQSDENEKLNDDQSHVELDEKFDVEAEMNIKIHFDGIETIADRKLTREVGEQDTLLEGNADAIPVRDKDDDIIVKDNSEVDTVQGKFTPDLYSTNNDLRDNLSEIELKEQKDTVVDVTYNSTVQEKISGGDVVECSEANNNINDLEQKCVTNDKFVNKQENIKGNNFSKDDLNCSNEDVKNSTNVGKKPKIETKTSTNTFKIKSDRNRSSIVKETLDFSSQKSMHADINSVNVKKRISENLSDLNVNKGDKNPQLHDTHTTAHVTTPDNSPEAKSPIHVENNILHVAQLYDEEAEALFRKQLAIEQEIKQLEQQQKEQIPYLYVREIPNKPPPPYTPPVTQAQNVTSILPQSPRQAELIIGNISSTLYKAFKNNQLKLVVAPKDTKSFLSKSKIDKNCYQFIFDLSKELALHHYAQFREDVKPSWRKVNKRPLVRNRPFDERQLTKYLCEKVKDLLNFEKSLGKKDNLMTKWSRKKKDHVDDLLVLESQMEETTWTNYDEDEVIVKNDITDDILNMLLVETVHVVGEALKRKYC